MKNILICCDGTNNQLNGDHTNVVRLYQVALKTGVQVAYYDPGVGTMPDPLSKAKWQKKWSLVSGLAFGAGLDENVFEAYRYLMRVYEPGDKIFLSGFSRGAFTVRVLAGMLHSVGLLHAGSENLLPYAWTYYREAIDPKGKAAEVCAELKKTVAQACSVEFLGVWDTVGSVGMYNWNQTFPYSYSNPDVVQVRHAVSLDERRAGFRSNIFQPDSNLLASQRPRVMNVWFPGVHSDVGGGYPRETSGLAMVAFEWMVREAKAAGLLLDDVKLATLLDAYLPDSSGPIHDELRKVGWKIIERLPARRFNWSTKETEWNWQPNKPRTLLPGQYLHRSILDRISGDRKYRPENLPSHSTVDLEGQFPIET
jgi:uncharacterized protein (DUF2235 family)